MNAASGSVPWARYMHPEEIAAEAVRGQRCSVRRCREPMAIYGLYYRRVAGVAEPVANERYLCGAHGAAFARRHHLEIGAAPAAVAPGRFPHVAPGVRLSGMGAGQIREHEERGWHCDRARCVRPARYSASLRYAVRGQAATRFWSGFLCVPHAHSFARRHGFDMATVRPPEVNLVSARRLFPGDLLAEFLERVDTSGPRARLEALATGQLEEFAVTGWHCGFPRCLDPVRYVSSLRYASRTGGVRQRGRFLCDRHARNFAVRHGLDVAAEPSPEGNSR